MRSWYWDYSQITIHHQCLHQAAQPGLIFRWGAGINCVDLLDFVCVNSFQGLTWLPFQPLSIPIFLWRTGMTLDAEIIACPMWAILIFWCSSLHQITFRGLLHHGSPEYASMGLPLGESLCRAEANTSRIEGEMNTPHACTIEVFLFTQCLYGPTPCFQQSSWAPFPTHSSYKYCKKHYICFSDFLNIRSPQLATRTVKCILF